MDIQDRDFEILRTLLESRIATSMHISVLHFEGKIDAAWKRLQKLKSARLIVERRPRLNAPAMLFLGQAGLKILKERGILSEYPGAGAGTWKKRTQVSEFTIRHELQVMDVKAAFYTALRGNTNFKVAEFSTWPALNEFESVGPDGRRQRILPDGFIRIGDQAQDGDHTYFLEVDRSQESQDKLAAKCACYGYHYRSGGFAVYMGDDRSQYKVYPFRLLVILQTRERRNNTAERLLQLNPPMPRLVWLTTFEEVTSNPVGPIWTTPGDFQAAIEGTEFEHRGQRFYRRRPEREILVDSRIRKLTLFQRKQSPQLPSSAEQRP